MSRDGGRKHAYSKKVANNNRSSVFKTPDNTRDVIRSSAGNLRDQIFHHLDAASRSDGGYEQHAQYPQTTNSRQLSQQNTRMLKLNSGKGFFFPRRQRFNEDLNQEIES
jgi:hypothetical protein